MNCYDLQNWDSGKKTTHKSNDNKTKTANSMHQRINISIFKWYLLLVIDFPVITKTKKHSHHQDYMHKTIMNNLKSLKKISGGGYLLQS